MCVGRVPSTKKNMDMVNFPCLQLESVPAIENFLVEKTDNSKLKDELVFTQDILAVMTIWTKDVLFFLNDCFKSVTNTKAYKILSSTTQPAHVVTSAAVLWIAFLCRSRTTITTLSPIWTLLYLGSFSAHFGAQIWMTFVSGLALYFSLPRHTFGSIQKVLFPKYFLLNATLSLVTLVIFLTVKNHELKTMEIGIQAIAMFLCFLIELVIFLYLTPPLLVLISIKIQIEKEAGVGLEVGKLEPGNLLKCPHYVKIHKAFRKIHMQVAIGNVVTMACTSLHLYYLACKLSNLSL